MVVTMLAPCVPKKPVIKWPRTPPNSLCSGPRRRRRARSFGGDMYRIYVTLKNGNEATGLELHKGSPPARGTELEVPLMRGGSVQARIGSITNTKRIGGPSVLVVKEV